MRILITGVGGAAGVALIQHLLPEKLEIFAGDIDPYAAGFHLVDAKHRLALLEGKHANFVDFLLELCVKHRIDLLVPTVDVELLPIAQRHQNFVKQGTRVLLTSEASLRLCLDKYRCFDHLRQSDWLAPFALFDDNFSPEAWDYPLIFKPCQGSGSRGVEKVDSPDFFKQRKVNPAYLVQEYLPGTEYSVDVLVSPQGEVLAAVPRSRLKVDSGSAVTAEVVKDADLEEGARTLAAQLGIQYVANIQFRRDRQGKPKLLEINPRFPGTMPLTVASGVNMPVLAVDLALGKKLTKTHFDFSEVAMTRVWQEIFFQKSALDDLIQAKQGL